MISKHLRDVLLKIPLRSKKGARRSYEWKWSILVVLDMILKSFFGVEGLGVGWVKLGQKKKK